MRLLVVSDVHLEFGPFVFPKPMPEFDVAVFAGDMHRPIVAALDWMADQREDGPLLGRQIVYVAGNHEFYKSEMKGNLAAGAEQAAAVGIHLLQRRTVIIGDVRFIGCTLWTDYRLLGTPKPSMVFAGQELNDHRLIRYREEGGHYSRFMPWHAAAEHRLDLAFIRSELGKLHDGPTIVVTHHAPHPRSVQPRHQGSALSPAFVSDLSALIEDFQPELWIHGHDHGSHDYRVGRTRVLANQAGYPNVHGYRENPWFHPSLVVEV
ncbi:metallophosphoesterase [Bosea sp. (in: a-proteobacteria)]|uniref:metallophosphoesterase n=1 Tax=Bosea sp. (in: a-proteobacteria) TaxID=1871050 RepID=UPI002732D6A6|nr:metallophosphoesterase [Bosea sp. (in: a-proteobacteria)]MDP3256719.1 metallophosphoesterase [Bosea sp. (in: a-proteobacteria)]